MSAVSISYLCINISVPLTSSQIVAIVCKMEVLLRQMAPRDAIWLVVVVALKLVEVGTDWICTLTAALHRLDGLC
jgi:hypothetical protein